MVKITLALATVVLLCSASADTGFDGLDGFELSRFLLQTPEGEGGGDGTCGDYESTIIKGPGNMNCIGGGKGQELGGCLASIKLQACEKSVGNPRAQL